MQKEIEKLKLRQENDMNALQLRIKSNYGNFKRERAVELEKLFLKYKNKMKELENRHKYEISNFSKILKGVASNLKYN
jgi:hypothetical protein